MLQYVLKSVHLFLLCGIPVSSWRKSSHNSKRRTKGEFHVFTVNPVGTKEGRLLLGKRNPEIMMPFLLNLIVDEIVLLNCSSKVRNCFQFCFKLLKMRNLRNSKYWLIIIFKSRIYRYFLTKKKSLWQSLRTHSLSHCIIKESVN